MRCTNDVIQIMLFLLIDGPVPYKRNEGKFEKTL